MARQPILESTFTPIYYTCGAMLVILVLGLVLPRGPNAGLIRTCISLSAFCIWLFWLVVYMAQMNPIMCPKIRNTSLAWIARKWGEKMEDLLQEPEQRF